MKTSARFLVGLFSVIALSLSLASMGAGPSVEDVAEKIEEEAVTSMAQQIAAGPFKITVGPDQDGNFGAVLAGKGSTPIRPLNSAAPSDALLTSGRSFMLRYGMLEFAADASWSSKQDALNQTALSLTPQVTFTYFKGSAYKSVVTPFVQHEKCELIGFEFDRRNSKKEPPADVAARIGTYGLDKLDDASLQAEFQRSNGATCNSLAGARPPLQQIAFGVYPDLRYRFGRFSEGGTVYDANQFILGGGVRLFAPGATRMPLFREPPRISVGYYAVKQTDESTVPLPEGIKKDFLLVEGRVLLRVPIFGHAVGTSPIQLDVEPSASKSAGGDWELLWKAQLSLISDSQFVPAITYRSGEEHGLKYERQLILGFLWQLVRDR